jgi:peptide/nickel transport system permease protein
MYGMIYDNASRMWMPYVYRYAVYPERDVFGTQPQNMTLGVEITFLGKPTINNAETTVFIDGLYFRAYGTSWGMLGTDKYGRDLLAQLIYGVRLSLYVGLLASIIGVVLGLIVGLSAGYLGKAVDELLMRFSDALLVIPGLPLLIVLVAVLGATINNLIILLGLLGWMGFARTVRSQVLSLRERPFIEAAKAAGAGKIHIMTRHVLPNVMSLVYVTLATSVPGAVVAEASLSWLGFYDPSVMSWGRMLNAVQFEASGAYDKWWWALPPGLCIALLALSFILIGFSMDEVLNPRLRARA